MRPHDFKISLTRDEGTIEALARRVLHLGFEVRVQLVLPDGSEASAQLTRAQADELELADGDIVYVRPPAGVAVESALRGEVSREPSSVLSRLPPLTPPGLEDRGARRRGRAAGSTRLCAG